jgi:hypothetical protein
VFATAFLLSTSDFLPFAVSQEMAGVAQAQGNPVEGCVVFQRRRINNAATKYTVTGRAWLRQAGRIKSGTRKCVGNHTAGQSVVVKGVSCRNWLRRVASSWDPEVSDLYTMAFQRQGSCCSTLRPVVSQSQRNDARQCRSLKLGKSR